MKLSAVSILAHSTLIRFSVPPPPFEGEKLVLLTQGGKALRPKVFS